MLARQHRGRRGHDHLISRQRGDRRGAQGHFGLAVADIADDEPLHRLAGSQIVAHRSDGARLIGRLVIGKARDEAFIGRGIGLHRRGRLPGPFFGQSDQRFRGFRDRLVDFRAALVPARAIELVQFHAVGIAAVTPQQGRVAGGHQTPRFLCIFERDHLAPLRFWRGFQTDNSGKAVIFVNHQIVRLQFRSDKADLTRSGRRGIEQRARPQNIRRRDERDIVIARSAIERGAQEIERIVVFCRQGAQALAMLDDFEGMAQAAAQKPQVALAADNGDSATRFAFGLQKAYGRPRRGFLFREAGNRFESDRATIAFQPPVFDRRLPAGVIDGVQIGLGLFRRTLRELCEPPAPLFRPWRQQQDAGCHMIDKRSRRVSLRLCRAAYRNRVAGIAAQLRDGIEMMDRGNPAIGQIDPHGISGIGGIEIDHLAANGDFARLVDAIVQEIAEFDRLFAKVVGIDRIAYADAGWFGIESVCREITPRGGLSRGHHNEILLSFFGRKLSQPPQRGDAVADIGWRWRRIVARQGIACGKMDNRHLRQQRLESRGKALGLGIVVAQVQHRAIADISNDAQHLCTHADRSGGFVVGRRHCLEALSRRGGAREAAGHAQIKRPERRGRSPFGATLSAGRRGAAASRCFRFPRPTVGGSEDRPSRRRPRVCPGERW